MNIKYITVFLSLSVICAPKLMKERLQKIWLERNKSNPYAVPDNSHVYQDCRNADEAYVAFQDNLNNALQRENGKTQVPLYNYFDRLSNKIKETNQKRIDLKNQSINLSELIDELNVQFAAITDELSRICTDEFNVQLEKLNDIINNKSKLEKDLNDINKCREKEELNCTKSKKSMEKLSKTKPTHSNPADSIESKKSTIETDISSYESQIANYNKQILEKKNQINECKLSIQKILLVMPSYQQYIALHDKKNKIDTELSKAKTDLLACQNESKCAAQDNLNATKEMIDKCSEHIASYFKKDKKEIVQLVRKIHNIGAQNIQKIKSKDTEINEYMCNANKQLQENGGAPLPPINYIPAQLVIKMLIESQSIEDIKTYLGIVDTSE